MLSERQQRQAIYALFAGGDTKPERQSPEEFEEPWRSVLARLTWFYSTYERDIGKTVDGIDWRTHYHEELLDCLTPAVRRLRTHPQDIISMLAEAGRQRRKFQNAAQEGPTLPPTKWIWQGWIPRGLLTLLGATPKTGKSWLALDLAQRITTGSGTWPDGQAVTVAGNVVWVEAEGVAQITYERGTMLGVNMNRLWMLKPPRGDILDLTSGPARDDLIELVQHTKPQIIIIDSLSGITPKGENNIEDIRRLLAFLVGLADDNHAGLLLIHHIKKLDRAQLALPGLSLYDFRGSGHITAVARSIIGLSVQSPANGPVVKSGPRRLEVVGATLCETPEPLGMTISSEGGGLRLIYGEAPDAGTTTGDECANWLLELLQANGPMKPKEVIEEAQTEGYERSMVFRTRKKLTAAGIIVNTLGDRNPKNAWKLADDAEIEGD